MPRIESFTATFGALLKECRKKSGLTQKQLAQAAHCDHAEISRFESGKKMPSVGTYNRLHKALADRGVPWELLEQLRALTGQPRDTLSWYEHPPTNATILYINEQYGRLQGSLEEQTVNNDLAAVLEADLSRFSAYRLLEQREWDAALKVLQAAERRADSFQKAYHAIKAGQGQAHYSLGNYDSAIDDYESALQAVERLERAQDDAKARIQAQNDKAQILIALGNCYRRRSVWKIARGYYSSAKDVFEKLGNRNGRVGAAGCLIRHASLDNFRGEAKKALALCEEALSIAHKEGDEKTVYKAQQHQAWAYRLLGEWGRAVQLNEQVRQFISARVDDRWEHLRAHLYTAEAYRLNREWDSAHTAYLAAQHILDEIRETGPSPRLHEGHILLGLGSLYARQPEQHQKARDHLQRSKELYHTLGEEFRSADVLNQMGNLMRELGEPKIARVRLEHAAQWLRRLDTPFHYVDALVGLCRVYSDLEEWNALEATAQEAMRVEREEGDSIPLKFHLARLHLLLAQVCLDTERIDDVAGHVALAIENARAFNEKTYNEIISDLDKKGKQLEGEGRPEKAAILYQAYVTHIVSQSVQHEDQIAQDYNYFKSKLSELQVSMSPT